MAQTDLLSIISTSALLIWFTAVSLSGCFEIATFQNVSVTVRYTGRNTSQRVFVRYEDNLGKHVDSKFAESLSIHNQFIPKLAANSLANLPKLLDLSLTFNGIRDVQAGAFRNVFNLKTLNLSHNLIEEIKNDVFSDMLSVQSLHLENNKITRIAHKAFNGLQIGNLYLNNNKLARWSREWFIGSSVLNINFDDNLLDDLPPNAFHYMLKPPKNEMSISFSNNQLHHLNPEVFSGFQSFSSVSFEGNQIENIKPGVFDGVVHIKTLNLNNNSIRDIDVNLFKKTRIDILMLEDNKLKCLSTDLFGMEELDIDGNPITCACIKTWLDWRGIYSNPSIYHITNLEQDCI